MRHHRRTTLKLSLLSSAIASVASFSPTVVAAELCAGQPTITVTSLHPADSCNLNQNNATLTVTSTGSIGLGVDVNGDPVIIVNNGVISAAQTALHYLGSHSVASVTNNGTLSVDSTAAAYGLHSNGTVDLSGQFLNTGLIDIQSTVVGGGAAAYGVSIADNVDGVLDNRGRFTIGATGSNAYAYGIDVVQDVSGSIRNSGSVVASVKGSHNAYDWGLTFSNLTGAGSVGNSGTLQASAEAPVLAQAFALSGGDLTGTAAVANSGTLKATATATAAGGSGTALGLGVGTVTGSATLTNSGSITATAAAASGNAYGYGLRTGDIIHSGSVLNSGTITVGVTGVGTSNKAYGIFTNSLNDSGSLTNTGTINATMRDDVGFAYDVGMYVVNDASGTATVNNTGTITLRSSGYSAEASGLWIAGTLQAGTAATNSGSISAVATGKTGNAYAYGWSVETLKGELANSGTLDVRAAGPAAVTAEALWANFNTGGTLRNTGKIMAEATASGSGSARAVGIWSYVNTLGANITNTSDVQARATVGAGGMFAFAAGIFSSNVDSSSSISNSGHILAETNSGTGPVGDAYGIMVQNLDGTITNTGTLDARASGSPAAAYGIVTSTGSGTVVNSGTINRGVALNGSVSMSNDGNLVNQFDDNSYVGGNYTQGASGVLSLQVQNAGSHSALLVAGTADFSAGDQVRITVTPDVMLANGSTIAGVISAGTLVTDLNGVTVTDTSRFWNFTGVRNGNALDLKVGFAGAAAGLADSGQPFTPSQLAYADNVLQGGYGGDYGALAVAMNGAPTAQAAADALESVAPGLPGAAAVAARLASDGASHAISARLGETRGAAAGDAFAHKALWIKPFYGKATQDSVSGVDGYDADARGFVIGIDGDVSDAWRLGVAVASSDGSVDGEKTGLDVGSTQLSVYGRYAISDSAALDLHVDEATLSVDSTRRVALAGSTARATFDGAQFALGATLSNRIAMGERGAFIPSLQARYQRIGLDGYAETGAGVYDLVVNTSTENSLLWAAQGAFEFGLGAGTLLANLGAGYDTRDAASLTSTLNGGTGPSFINFGNPVDSTVLTGGLGYRYVTTRNVQIEALYDLERRSDFEAQIASVKVKMLF